MNCFVKRTIDIILSAALLLILSPLIAGISLLIVVMMGTPVLYPDVRAGYKGKPFILSKFRTMTSDCDSRGALLPDADRLTPAGRLLRRFSLDELPQLWNVLRGDMSIVGPRPLLVRYLPRYSAEQARRHDVKPGLTGWAQINGRNSVNWTDRFLLDCWYVDHASLILDFKIMLSTVSKVFRGDGLSQIGHATMPEFLGEEPHRT